MAVYCDETNLLEHIWNQNQFFEIYHHIREKYSLLITYITYEPQNSRRTFHQRRLRLGPKNSTLMT